MSLWVRVREGEVVPGCLGAWVPGAWVPGGEGTVRLLPINIRRRASSAKQSKEVPNHSPGPEQSKQTPPHRGHDRRRRRRRRQRQRQRHRHRHRHTGPDRPGHGRAGQHSAAQRSAAQLSSAQHSTAQAQTATARNRAARLALRPWSRWKAEGQAALLSS
jgi:hypothetical protein